MKRERETIEHICRQVERAKSFSRSQKDTTTEWLPLSLSVCHILSHTRSCLTFSFSLSLSPSPSLTSCLHTVSVCGSSRLSLTQSLPPLIPLVCAPCVCVQVHGLQPRWQWQQQEPFCRKLQRRTRGRLKRRRVCSVSRSNVSLSCDMHTQIERDAHAHEDNTH